MTLAPARAKEPYEFKLPPATSTSDDINYFIDTFWQGAVLVGRYVIPAEDVIILIDGKDFDGVEQDRALAAGFLMVGLVPGSKLMKPVVKIVNGITKYRKIIIVGPKSINLSLDVVGGVVDFGVRSTNNSKLRQILGMVKGDGKHAHHIIPWDFRGMPLVQKAARSDKVFHISEKLNGIPLPSANHLTGHGRYNDKINRILDNLYDPSMSENQAYSTLKNFIDYLDNLIRINPNKNLGEIADMIKYGK